MRSSELPDTHLLVVSVQRDSNPILFYPGSGEVVRKLDLGGTPEFQVRASANEIWATDYDYLVKLDAKTLNVITSKRLQDETPRATRQFIGEVSICRSDGLCLVARPFSGDVIGLDCESMVTTHRVGVGTAAASGGSAER